MNWQKLKGNKNCTLGILILTVFTFLALCAPLIVPFGAEDIDITQRLQPLSFTNWMGTDEMGRDVFSRVIFGTRYAFLVVLLVVFIVVPIGMIVGLTAGYYGGIVDKCLMRITDICLILPRLILALAFVVMLGIGLRNAIIAVAITAWAPYARLVRSQAIIIKQADYITALRLQNVGHMRMLFKYILPLCMSSLIVQVSLDMSGFILAVAGLGFLGLGAQPPAPEWGAMIAAGRVYLLNNWWVITFPGLAIALLSLGFNLFGEGLRDVLDLK